MRVCFRVGWGCDKVRHGKSAKDWYIQVIDAESEALTGRVVAWEKTKLGCYY